MKRVEQRVLSQQNLLNGASRINRERLKFTQREQTDDSVNLGTG
jgi:hypothetical protein